MRYLPGLFVLIAAAAWTVWFASGVGERTVGDQIVSSRHLPADTVLSPYARLSGRPDGDFTRQCWARTNWYDVRWNERQVASEADGGVGKPEQVAVRPRWDRVLAVAVAGTVLGVLLLWLGRRSAVRRPELARANDTA